MLILARRPEEKIVIPCISTTIQILSIKGNAVRLGIDAPATVQVLRDNIKKLPAAAAAAALPVEAAEARLRAFRHLVRNRLNGVTIGLALLRHQVPPGAAEDLERTVALIESETNALRRELDAEAARTPPSPKPAAKVRRALLVEDDQNERELLAGLLRLSGFAVDTAGDGCDALDHLRVGAKPDVVLMDLGLPRCDGVTAAREIRRDPTCAGMRIFAVTGHSPSEYQLDQGPQLIDRWFQKPIDPASLLRELAQELGAV